MVIKFVCRCGKHLKARDEMAARRSMCPACGAPVGVPSLCPTTRGAPAGPLSREEIRARAWTEPSLPTDSLAPDLTEASTPPPAKQGRARPVIGHFPRRFTVSVLFGTLPMRVGLLSAALTVLSGWAALLWTNQSPAQENAPILLFLALTAVAAFPVLGQAGNLLEFVLLWASGDVRRACWPGWNLRRPLLTALTWTYCLLAGPVLPAAAALWYWFTTGDLVFLDWLVLAELGVLAVGYWLLAVVVVTRSGRLLNATPFEVARLAHRLNWRAALAILAASALALALGRLALAAIPTFHEDVFEGWLLLAGLWVGGLTAATGLFALLGHWCRRLGEEKSNHRGTEDTEKATKRRPKERGKQE
jgi:hypothetical protein